MMNLAEYRRSNTRLADFLPWAALVDEGIVLNKDGSFQRTAKFRGPDLDSAVPAELVAVAGRLNNALRRLESGWAIFVEAQRHSAGTYPPDTFPDAVSSLVDAERRAQFEEAGAHYESSYFLTFLYLPPAEGTAKAERLLYEGSNRSVDSDAREILRGFADRTSRVLQLVEGFMPECAWLDDEETLTYLHSTVSTKRHRVRVPEIPMYLDALLADQPLTGGLEPMLGSSHLRILTIVGFPTATTPGILDDLNRLPFAYRWSTRAIMIDKTDATKLLTRIRRQWFAKRKSLGAILKEVMTNEASALLDTDAHNKALDADAALQELGSDQIGEAFVTTTITVWDNDPTTVDEKLRLVEKVIQGRDFTCMIETVNAIEAWLGSLPGHAYANVRQPPLSTLNLAHMIPLSAVWAGPARDEHFKAPPLLFGKTEGSTPFRFSLHVGDVGHTLIVGPTGAGKTSIGRRLAAHYGLSFVGLDQEIGQHCGVDVNTVFEIEGEAGFRQRESALLDECSRRSDVLLATGAGAVLAEANRRQLGERGYVVWLQATIEQQLERLERDQRRPLLAVPDRHARLQAMAQAREPLYRELADLAVPGERGSVAAASERCIALIDLHWQRSGARPRQTA
jgi:type IV secretion system protein VirB4